MEPNEKGGLQAAGKGLFVVPVPVQARRSGGPRHRQD